MTCNEFDKLNLREGTYILVTQEFKSDINGKTIRTTESFKYIGKGLQTGDKDATILVEEKIGVGTLRLKVKNITEIKVLS